ncbi:sensor histidine kinase [Nocardioides sp. GXZ039]|uniref:sensor histidine kinase n=1 Tax=Nocardioides sp. GXZ039 TaxID=3136018 RepID=UPI0030F3F811
MSTSEVPDASAQLRRSGRLGPRATLLLDVGVVGFLLLLTLLSLASGQLTGLILGPLQSLPLLWRRRYPVAVFWTVSVATAAQLPFTDIALPTQFAFPIAVYSVARFGSVRSGWVGLAVGAIASLVAAADWTVGLGEARLSTFLPLAFTNGAFVVAAWALGTLGRIRSAYVDALVERAERIQRDAEQQVALAASAERSRIAREMHDVVAHGLTVIVVQADGARYAAAQDPAVAAETLTRIAATGREALTDTRHLLGLLRAEETGRSPLPGLTDLPDLLDGVEHDLVGLDRPVPTAVALTTYRVVQEAVTNIRKHAGPSAGGHVRVTVSDQVEIEVTDEGRGASAGVSGPGGHGLLGMRERIDVHGGTLETGPRPGGGFGVRARIPL